jgi:hypothetical protein
MLAFAGRFVVTRHKPAQEAQCASVRKYSAVSGPLSEMITKATLGPIPGIVIAGPAGSRNPAHSSGARHVVTPFLPGSMRIIPGPHR